MIVAEITKDHLFSEFQEVSDSFGSTQIGRQFDSEALRRWWGWGIRESTPADTYFMLAESNYGRTQFKLYDDDGELYYEGWLVDDDECMVQQFVLDWAKADSGCTDIKVLKDGKYIQVIG